jgi:hypothetical protein
MHEKHFSQQQIIHPAIINYQRALTEFGPMSSSTIIAKDYLDSLIPDEQKKLYQDIMANTEARKAREAAEKIAAKEAAKKAAEEKAKRDAENSWSTYIFGKKDDK